MNPTYHFFLSALAVVSLLACSTSEERLIQATIKTTTPAETPMEFITLGAMRTLHRKGDVYLGSQPTAEDLAALKQAGLKTVINMRKAGEMDFDAAGQATGLGLNYSNPGWNGPDELTDELFDQYRVLLSESEFPLLLHCASSNRVGPIWMAWQVLDRGADLEQATAEAKMAGMRTPEYEAKALDYIARRSK